MCTNESLSSLPVAATSSEFHEEVSGHLFGEHCDEKAPIAILPDIYGCGPFYRQLATYLSNNQRASYLVDPFAGLEELTEHTREAAFARRNKVSDLDFVDRFHSFVETKEIGGVVGFCLGGLYIFELARRGVRAELIGLYGFPQGLPNFAPLPIPFDYLPSVDTRFTMMLGDEDTSVGRENIDKLASMQEVVPAMNLKIYPGVGHNFLKLLDSKSSNEREIARDALGVIESAFA